MTDDKSDCQVKAHPEPTAYDDDISNSTDVQIISMTMTLQCNYNNPHFKPFFLLHFNLIDREYCKETYIPPKCQNSFNDNDTALLSPSLSP